MPSLRLAALCLVCACATTPPPPSEAPPGVERHADAIDWAKAGDEAAQVLAGYLRVDTFNPPGNETRGAQYLADVLAKEGITAELLEFAPGRSNLIARLPATGPANDKPLCLLSHIDVVPAEAVAWPKDKGPLSGVIDENGVIWGRGALDMKGMGVLELMTLVWLKRANVPLARDVVLLAVGDEEVDNLGMKQLVEQHWSRLDCGQLVNEGGLGVKNLLFEGQTVFAVSVAEKGALWLRMTASGEAGHGSTPVPSRAPTRLVEAVKALSTRTPKPQIHAALYELLRRIGEQKGGVTGFVLQRPLLVDWFVTGRLMSKPPTRAGITNTCQVTGFDGKGSAPNVIPSQVSAIIDCRLLPGTTPEAVLEELKGLVKGVEGIEFTVLNADGANESTWVDPFFDALARQVVKGRTDVVAGPVLSPGYTDSLLARPKGTRAYGMVPFEVTQEELGTMHGRDERVSKANVTRGLEVLFRAVVDVSVAP
ncbi:MAG: M20/M25/M40 family metallo-hydrolase [Myxococcaceae bacterium]|jgi:acetylornithine deacetylase/succinyl-diaminopimelate desuccinylase-like protein|nr:M20/M25/M40 family metallo-hydrolase [Myxococcaceae bacterium]